MSAGRNVDVPELQIPPQPRAPSIVQRPWTEPGFQPLQGGFRDHFVFPPEPKYCCEACHLVLCNPRQTECGHRFCETCISKELSKPHPVCPADMEPLFEDKIFRDVCCNREIMALKVYCRSEKNGCKEQMTLQQVMDHLNVCPYFEVPCPLGKCKEQMMRKDMPEHLARKCKYRESTCEFCKHKMALTEIEKHKETVCPAFPVHCPNNCASSILRSELSSHQHECPKAQVSCAFNRFGCTFKGLNQEMKDHDSSFVSEHLLLMATRNATLEAKVEDIKGELQERYKVLPSMNSRLLEMESLHEDMREKIRQVEQKLSGMQKVMSSHSEKVLEIELDLNSLRLVQDEVETLRSTVENIRSRVNALETGRGGPSTGTQLLGSLENQLSRHDDLLSVHEIRLADMDLRFQVLETASYNGTLIWKIRDYKRRKQEAVASKTLSLYSQPFYTGYFGYKMCARVYLNGDGMGKGTHLSLFFVVMRGEYDALLPWPFKQKVTLMLMDQGPARKHLGDAFKPDPNSSSFRRPVAEMNIASGCPLFVAQTVLENGTYIKEDTIFIKVTVDTSDLPDP
ncbi:TNF receptor-associated factor 3 isoform X2 [Brienomyrus brachyistius]|nr:TNF receptor-associated factor 3 isoform X2 [Brienomyrus brachyistius]XP_048830113.1 TNF receptor-associated factor 3 isoform X2 [Brienomyrus brachyistius]XP_048830114.1 TNF receptor-associated factor 3 isoform X2 [Brienomyrus brachyistius]